MMHDRYESRIDFSDSEGVVWTTDQDETWLNSLDEGLPPVRTSFLEIPASDGAIDLTEAVAGRPLYGRRDMKMVVSHFTDTRAEAVEWAHDAAAKLHGKELVISTPHSRALESWYRGRVEVEIKYLVSQQTAQLTITADCEPWIYYGTATVTLAPGSTSTVSGGIPLTDEMRAAYSLALVNITRAVDSYSQAYATAARRIAYVESSTDNIAYMPGMMRFCRWDIDAADVADWTTAWTYTQVDTANNSITFATEKDKSSRMFALAYPSATPDDVTKFGGMAHTGRKMFLGLHVTGMVTDTDSTAGTPAVKIVHQGGRSMANTGAGKAVNSAAGGLVTSDSSQRTTYTEAAIGNDGTVDAFVTLRSDIIVYGSDHSMSGAWCTVGVEVDWCDAEITCEVYLGWVDSNDYIAPSGVCRLIDLPTGMYAATGKVDSVDINALGAVLNTWYKEQGTSVVAQDAETQYQLGTVPLTGSPKWCDAYIANLCWRWLNDTVTASEQQTVTVDAGDMPTTFSIETFNPLIAEIDGTRYLVTSSGFAPFAFSGEEDIDYVLYGDTAATITYEKGQL